MPELDDLVDHVRRASLPPAAERRRIRRRANLTLEAVGKAAGGVSAQTVLRWERGERPTLEHAIAYRELLDALREAVDAS